MRTSWIAVLATFLLFQISPPAGLRFEVANLLQPSSGRLLVILAQSDRPEPRNTIGDAGTNASIILGRDVENLGANIRAVLDNRAAAFPIQKLDELPAGDYYVQAQSSSSF